MQRVILLSLISVGWACSSSPVLPPEGPTIRDIYDQHTGAADVSMRQAVSPPVYRVDVLPGPIGDTKKRFTRLYNPTLHLYVYPHLAGAERVPVPGYYTVFSLYERDEYALPGEPIDP